jgi:glycosyltransferase involved in cell wall biosynthesis
MTMHSPPTVSIILYGYNVARFVGRAAQSLLAQDYRHTNFYFSDDGSTDGSAEVLRAACAHSARPVTIHVNPTNLGICNQINAGVAATNGALVMLANADDIYPPDYVSRLVAAWRARTPHPMVVWAQMAQIDEDDRPLGKVMHQQAVDGPLSMQIASRAAGPGATGVLLDRRVFSEFGPLPDNLMLEDACLNARAFILGAAHRIEEPLVKYRVHTDNISQVYATGDFDTWAARHQKRAVWQMRQGHRAFVEMLRDLHQRPADALDAQEAQRARWIAVEKIAETTMLADFFAHDHTISGAARWAMLWRLASLQIKLTLKRWLPFIHQRNLRWEYRQYRDGN